MIKEQKILIITGIYDYVNKTTREVEHNQLKKYLEDGYFITNIIPFINGSGISALSVLIEKEKISNL